MDFPTYEEFEVTKFIGGMVAGKNPPADIAEEDSVLIQDFFLTEEGDLQVAPGRNALTTVFDTANPTTGVGVLSMFDDDDRLSYASGERCFFATFQDVFTYDTQAQWGTGIPIRTDWSAHPGMVTLGNVAALFNRNSIAFDDKGVLYPTGAPRYLQGKYGLNISVEEGTQNLVRDASFETATAINHANSPWQFSGLLEAGKTARKTVADRWEGVSSAHILCRSGADPWGIFQAIAPPAGGWVTGDRYCLTAKVRVLDTQPGGVKIAVYAMNSAFFLLSESRQLLTRRSANWEDINVTITVPANTAHIWVDCVAFNEGGVLPNASFYVDAVQVERKPYPTTFIRAIDDTTQVSRDAEYFIFADSAAITSGEGTLDLQISPLTEVTRVSVVGGEYIDFVYGNMSSTGFYIYHTTLNNSGIVGVKYYSATGMVEFRKSFNWGKGKPYNVTFTWDSAGCYFYLEGKQEGFNTRTFVAPAAGNGFIGGAPPTPTRLSGNALYEGIRVSDTARQKDIVISNHTNDRFLFDGNVIVRWNYEPVTESFLVGKSGYGFWESPWIDLLAVVDRTRGYIRHVKDDTATILDIETTYRATGVGAPDRPWVLVGSGGRIRNVTTARFLKIRAKIYRVEDSIPLLDRIAGYYRGHLPVTIQLTGLTNNIPMNFTAFMNKLVLSNGIDSMRIWDGSSEMPRIVRGRPPSGKFLQVFANYLFFAGSIDRPARLFWSGLLDVDGYGSRNFIDIPPEDDSITGLIKYGDYLYIAKNKSFHSLSGSGPEDFRTFKIHSVGCTAPASLVVVESMVAFVNDDGIYFSNFTGEPVNMITAKYMQAEWNKVNKQHLHKATAVYFDNKLFVCVPYETSTFNNFTFIFDLKHKAWTISRQTASSCFSRFRNGDANLVIFGLPNRGQVAYWHSGWTDLGVNIVSILETKRWSLEHLKNYKVVRQIYLNLTNAIGGTGNTGVTVRLFADDVLIPNSFSVLVPNRTVGGTRIARIVPMNRPTTTPPTPPSLITCKTIGVRMEESTNNGGVGINGIIIRYSVKHRSVI